MATQEKKTMSTNFLTVYNGNICQRVPAGTPNSIEVTSKMGNVRNLLIFDSVISTLKGLTVSENEFSGKTTENLNVKLFDGFNYECLSVQLNSNEAQSIVHRLSSTLIDLNAEIRIAAMLDEKKYSLVYIQQNGITIKSAFSKENPAPAWKQLTVNGAIVWDKTEFLIHLKSLIKAINDKVKTSETEESKNAFTGVDESQIVLYYDKKGNVISPEIDENGTCLTKLFDKDGKPTTFNDLPF
jgi:hypothetical protein